MILVMKDFLKLVLILFVPVFFATCHKGENEDENGKGGIIKFWLSQPRDAALFGWWEAPYDSVNNMKTFWKFKQTGTITDLVFQNDKVEIYYEDRHYWYTEKLNDKNAMYAIFDDDVWFIESDNYYKIVGDSLWVSNEISDTSKLYFFMTKTVAPEGYE
jgi:hypothetical protein